MVSVVAVVSKEVQDRALFGYGEPLIELAHTYAMHRVDGSESHGMEHPSFVRRCYTFSGQDGNDAKPIRKDVSKFSKS